MQNQLTNLDISGCTALLQFRCHYNQLTSLDISNNIALEWLYCFENQLTSLDVSNNTVLEILDLRYMPTLTEVCVWTIPFNPVGVEVDTLGSPNVFFTTECNN
jgi:Leucine-rich repeat (LRR) protein